MLRARQISSENNWRPIRSGAGASRSRWLQGEAQVGKRVSQETRRVMLEQLAPRYREASVPQKSALLDEVTALTHYNRKYATWLLNHAEEALQASAHARSHYGPEVRQALVLVWETLNQICARHLIPYLSTILGSLERHGHLHLREDHCRHLLSMSAKTAERILKSAPLPSPAWPFHHQSRDAGGAGDRANPQARLREQKGALQRKSAQPL